MCLRERQERKLKNSRRNSPPAACRGGAAINRACTCESRIVEFRVVSNADTAVTGRGSRIDQVISIGRRKQGVEGVGIYADGLVRGHADARGI